MHPPIGLISPLPGLAFYRFDKNLILLDFQANLFGDLNLIENRFLEFGFPSSFR